MNKAVTPDLAMGVRAPYTQTAIAEDGSWNEAGDIYTAYLTISGRSSYDGLNRIYVLARKMMNTSRFRSKTSDST